MNEQDLLVLLEKLEEKDNLNYVGTLPQTERGINTLIILKQGTKEELIEENRKLYAEKMGTIHLNCFI